MRSTSKFLSVLAASGLGLFVACSNSVWPEEADAVNPRVRELQQKRLAILESLLKTAQESFMHAQGTHDEIHNASLDLLAARREYAPTRNERIQACDDAVKEALAWREVVRGLVESGRAARTAELKAEAHVLKTQIDRQNAE